MQDDSQSLLVDEILIDEVATDNENSIGENINVLKSSPIKSSDTQQNSDINLIEIDLRKKIKEVSVFCWRFSKRLNY